MTSWKRVGMGEVSTRILKRAFSPDPILAAGGGHAALFRVRMSGGVRRRIAADPRATGIRGVRPSARQQWPWG